MLTLVTDSIQAIESEQYSNVGNEYLVITLPGQQWKKTKIVKIYLSPNEEIPKYTLLQLLLDKENIIIGDLNARHASWGNNVSNKRGRTVRTLLDCTSAIVHFTQEPTRHNYRGRAASSTFDLLITPQNTAVTHNATMDLTLSDHDLIHFHVKMSSSLKTRTTKPRYRETNYAEIQATMQLQFQHDLGQIPRTPEEVDTLCREIQGNLRAIMQMYADREI